LQPLPIRSLIWAVELKIQPWRKRPVGEAKNRHSDVHTSGHLCLLGLAHSAVCCSSFAPLPFPFPTSPIATVSLRQYNPALAPPEPKPEQRQALAPIAPSQPRRCCRRAMGAGQRRWWARRAPGWRRRWASSSPRASATSASRTSATPATATASCRYEYDAPGAFLNLSPPVLVAAPRKAWGICWVSAVRCGAGVGIDACSARSYRGDCARVMRPSNIAGLLQIFRVGNFCDCQVMICFLV
jgi:hypothetical protein